ncbi:thioesterase II family protein [Actinokineospora terrae]|uniref:Surfactin synthase thioesterase subunit n=1 Tax=Actinokineospora terrae TaxID=155974 RepID=A0A1H9LM71_9PSEU|nr:alpha/beta fold hydrolase [Actinokineospora terrae]SER12339.1 Surfactin synthase thioesterase subunit [Actinokineospora terrae]
MPPQPVRLYCVPYAGATSSIYRSWQAFQTASVRVIGIDHPGRGTRNREARITDYRDLVASMANHVAADLMQAWDQVSDLRYGTFGHSFGAMLSLAVADAVARVVGRPPVRSIVSAALPPALQPPGDETTTLTDAELLDKIRADGGTAPELLANKAMAGYLVRLMREDYAIRRQFHVDESLVVGFPLTTIAARDDVYVTPEQMRRWGAHSSAQSRQVEIPGGHFAAFADPGHTLRIAHHQLNEHLVRR